MLFPAELHVGDHRNALLAIGNQPHRITIVIVELAGPRLDVQGGDFSVMASPKLVATPTRGCMVGGQRRGNSLPRASYGLLDVYLTVYPEW